MLSSQVLAEMDELELMLKVTGRCLFEQTNEMNGFDSFVIHTRAEELHLHEIYLFLSSTVSSSSARVHVTLECC